MRANVLVEQRTEGGKSNRHAVVLAGGDGTRLRTLTRVITGDTRPKQFCPILNGETLVTLTRNRVLMEIEPSRIFYSLTKKHERFYKPLLDDISENQIVVQPKNKGTAPAILLSVMKLDSIDPDASIGFFPSDHYFSDDRQFMDNVDTGFRAVERNPDSLVLLGIDPKSPETSYGWIEPVDSIFADLPSSITSVKRFWEKPDAVSATYLMNAGCLWNSFVMIGKVSTFLALFEEHLTEMFEIFNNSLRQGEYFSKSSLNAIYRKINETNFSSEVLERAADRLFVMRVGNVEWSDLGEPKRVLGTVKGLKLQPEWLAYAGL